MKKIFYSMLALAMATFSLTSCEDVPEPYALPTNGGGDKPTTIEPAGAGTQADPFNIAAIQQEAEKLASGESTTENVYFKGIVSSIKEAYSSNFGNGTFYVSDDGTTNDQFYVYRAYYLGNEKYKDTDAAINIGDTVVICGKLTNYNGTLETVQNGAYIYSINGKTSADKGDTPDTGDVLSPINGTFINESFSSGFGVFTAETVKGTAWTIDFSTAKATGYDNTAKTTTASEAYLVSKPMDMSNTAAATLSFEYILRYYTNYGEAKTGVADKVLITDNYTGDATTTTWTDITGTLTEGSDWTTFYTYSAAVPSAFLGKGKVVVALYYACEDNSATWEVKNLTVKEGENGTVDPGTTESGESITIVATDMGFEDKAAMATCTLTDGTTLTFDKGEGTTAPAYYAGTYAAARMYAKNTLTIKSTKTITKIELETNSGYNGTLYNGNDQAYAQSGSTKVSINKESETKVSFSGLNNSTIVIVNDYTEAKAGTQLRIKSMTITYAK